MTTSLPCSAAAPPTRNATVTRSESSRPVDRLITTLPFCATSAPFSLVRLHRRPVRAVLDGLAARVLELRPRVGRDEVTALDPLEPVPFQEPGVLCLQQSTRDSTRPQIDLPPAFFAHRLLDRHVRDLDA